MFVGCFPAQWGTIAGTKNIFLLSLFSFSRLSPFFSNVTSRQKKVRFFSPTAHLPQIAHISFGLRASADKMFTLKVEYQYKAYYCVSECICANAMFLVKNIFKFTFIGVKLQLECTLFTKNIIFFLLKKIFI